MMAVCSVPFPTVSYTFDIFIGSGIAGPGRYGMLQLDQYEHVVLHTNQAQLVIRSNDQRGFCRTFQLDDCWCFGCKCLLQNYADDYSIPPLMGRYPIGERWYLVLIIS